MEKLTKKYKTLIVDDDEENIDLLKILLKKYCKDIEVVAQASSVEGAIDAYLEFNPEILLLDINLGLGNKNSFAFLDSIQDLDSEIVFITSYDDFAVKAIGYDVAGYVLKPIRNTKLVNAVNKAIQNSQDKKILRSKKILASAKSMDLLAIPYVDDIELIRTEDIVYLESDNRYTIFYMADGSTKIASRNLGEYEDVLHPNEFFRIHHSYIVNLNMVVNINKAGGNYCELLNGKALPIAKRRQDKLHEFLNLK